MTPQESKDTLYFKVPVTIADVIGHMACYFGAYQIFKHKYYGWELLAIDNWYALFSLLIASYVFTIIICKLKIAGRQISIPKVMLQTFEQVTLTILFFTIFVALIYKMVPRTILVTEWALALVTITISHTLVNITARILRSRGRNSTSILFIGNDKNNINIMEHVTREGTFSGYKILGAFISDSEPDTPDSVKPLGNPQEVEAYMIKHPHCADSIYCSLSPEIPEEEEIINKIITLCEQQLITFYYVPNMEKYVKHRMSYGEFGGTTIMKLYDEPLANITNRVIKRLFDIIVSGIFLGTLFPIFFVIISIGVKLSSPGPIFFKQKRTGYNGKSFYCLKFRSMRMSPDANSRQATTDDPRKTKFGDFIRKTSLDELPQFINVFIGDMSLVGPRPHMEHHTEVYSELISDYMVRHLVKPGITGWAQVNGCRGETKTTQKMKDRVEHDIWYIEHWSLGLDIEILLMTIRQILKGDQQAY